MKLSNIIKNLKSKEIIGFDDHNISCLTHNSKDVIANSVFFCINGQAYNGIDFVEEALNKGAKVIVAEHKVECSATQIIVANVRVAMSIMAKNFYGCSDEKLQKVAIVGTNGKTTTSHIVASILKESGRKVGVIGTNGTLINDITLPNSMTTPDPIELHYIFNQMVSFGVEVVVMEVSAHAIYYNKLYGVKFDVGVFTNISMEHLDFFGDMPTYAKVKTDFFTKQNIKEAVVNVDDIYGVQIAKNANIPVVSYGIYNPSNIFAVKISMNINGCKFTANVNDEIININTCFLGEYNVYNILASIGVCKMLGVSNQIIENALLNLKGVDGRFVTYDLPMNKKIIVDFAHTPDGFEKVLSLIKKLRRGKITCIFGCVGYSDSLKRAEMGKVASKYVDEIIISTDNIGNANFDDVCNDICSNIDNKIVVGRIEERSMAIEFGYNRMIKNETLVILGKGSETKQVVGDEWQEYSDIKVVENLLGVNK